jgi:hypothetical protein
MGVPLYSVKRSSWFYVAIGLDSQTPDSSQVHRRNAEQSSNRPVTRIGPCSRQSRTQFRVNPHKGFQLLSAYHGTVLKWVRSHLHENCRAKSLANRLIPHRGRRMNLRHCDLFAAYNVTKPANDACIEVERARHLSRGQTVPMRLNAAVHNGTG